MLNVAIIAGRLGADIELRYTAQKNTACATFSLAVDRDYVADDGERKTDWINVVCYGNTAEAVARRAHKGDLLVVDGRLVTRKYQDKNGNNKVFTEVSADRVYFTKPKAKVKDMAESASSDIDDEDLPY